MASSSDVLSRHNPEPKAPKRQLFDEESSSDSDGGAASLGLKVNEEFAKRFEHNKKREEKQRLEEKYKRGDAEESGSESESSDETEDDEAFLATDALDAKISETLNAIRNKDPRIYDTEAKFFTGEDETAQPRAKEEKPVFLKDYHRERFLAGGVGASDSEDGEDGPKQPKTYVEEQAELKESIRAEIDAAAQGTSDAEDDDRGFLKPKKPTKAREEKAAIGTDQLDDQGLHPSRVRGVGTGATSLRTITEDDVARADTNPELYLSNFMAAQGWKAGPDGSNWQAFESDEGEDDAELERRDEFEAAFNMRFEDPHQSNEVLKTYARDVAAARSVRRENPTARKRKRETEKEQKEREKQERAEEKGRLKKLRLDEAQDRLGKIRKTAGLRKKRLKDDDMLQFLEDNWDDEKWEEQMRKRFGDEYYGEEDADMKHDGDDDGDDGSGGEGKKKRKPKKPEWDDDIDIADIVKDDSTTKQFTVADLEDDDDQEEGGDDADSIPEDEDAPSSKKRKTSKGHKKDRVQAKKEAKQMRAKLEAIIGPMVELDEPTALTSSARPATAAGGEQSSSSKRGRKAVGSTFRWRETSPTGFGMTARDILLAPSDKALNRFAGIKKYVPYRDGETKAAERRRLSKKGRLKKWRREVYGREFEKTGPTFGLAEAAAAAEATGGAEDYDEVPAPRRGAGSSAGAACADGGVDIKEGGRKEKKRRRKKGHQKSTAADP